jgi:hypothetical protein
LRYYRSAGRAAHLEAVRQKLRGYVVAISPEDRQLIAIVHSDLQFLRDEWDNQVDDHSLRRSSPILRRFLVENDLHRAWKLAGFPSQALVRASTLEPILRTIPPHRITFASAGGGSYNGAEVRGALLLNFVMTEAQVKKVAEGPPPDREYRLLDFSSDTCVIALGKRFSRTQVVKYVANKLGGAHYDTRRGHRKDDAAFLLLDKVEAQVMLLDKPAIYFELLSIGQAIGASHDLYTLSTRLDEILATTASA